MAKDLGQQSQNRKKIYVRQKKRLNTTINTFDDNNLAKCLNIINYENKLDSLNNIGLKNA